MHLSRLALRGARRLQTRSLVRMSHRSLSSLSSFAEPDPSLFAHNLSTDKDAPLRKDIKVMGTLLGQVIQEQDTKVFSQIEDMRALAKQWRETRDDQTFQQLADYAANLSNPELFWVSRGFTHFLALANAAESHHRARRLHASDADGGLYQKQDSCGQVLLDLQAQGHDAHTIVKALQKQTTELVLTAHPTEVNRRTILNKKERIQNVLNQADAIASKTTATTSFQQAQLDDALYREIAGIWWSDEVSRFKPTPQTEAEKGTLVIETVLWKAVPLFLRKLQATVQNQLGQALPLDTTPLKFASWMGGDRDGNPNVRADTTRQVCRQNRAKAATLLWNDLRQLQGELSWTTCGPELRGIVGEGVREPYRAYLQPMVDKMKRTLTWVTSDETEVPDDIYVQRQDLLDELMALHRSLVDTNNAITANGTLTDIIRNVHAFGLTLVPLDVRQESDRHEEAMDAITRYLGLGRFSQWDEETKINWLTTQIASKRPLLRSGVWNENPDVFSETVVDTLETFQMVAEQPPDSLGAYVISQATSASDVLSVLLLQLNAGRKDPLRVVPLFETLDDLNGAEATMRKLFSLPTYMGIINGKHEVMIGYSDSAKDAGRLAAVWAQFVTQEKLSQVAKQNGVELTFFHGKGGTVGRGGNPQTFDAITSHPPETINGKFRVTEQGEMIFQNFGYHDRAERTLDIYTAAVLAEQLMERPKPKQGWRDMMEKLAAVSCDEYRRVVRHDDRFVPYFRSATPELELASLNIGSRPAKRKATGGVESLRAIPWNFAWTQTRFNLPTWLGVGTAIGQVLESEDADQLKDMYQNWDSFRTVIDLVEMVLSKSEPAIATHYDQTLVQDDKAKELGAELRQLHLDTEAAILSLTGHEELGENNKLLSRMLAVRNPYVDCLNVLQAETLKRTREVGEENVEKPLQDALMTTIGGIAAGMGNTG